MKLLDQTDGDLAAILKHYGVDRSRLATELTPESGPAEIR